MPAMLHLARMLRLPRLHSVQGRIALGCVALLLLTQIGTGLVLSWVGEHAARENVLTEMDSAGRVAQRILAGRQSQLSLAASVLAHDFGFREAVAKGGDLPTIASVLENHGSRIQADVALWRDADGRVLTSYPSLRPDQLARVSADLVRTGVHDQGLQVLSIGIKLYQVVEVPVQAPVLIGSVLLGFELDRELASELRRITGTEVGFAEATGVETLASRASTLDDAAAASAARQSGLAGSAPTNEIRLNRTRYLGTSTQIGILIGSRQPVVLLLHRSLDQAMQPFWNLQQKVFVYSLVTLLAAGILAMRVASELSQPIKNLARFARLIAAGTPAPLPPTDRRDEIGDLSRAFEQMRVDIEARERDIRHLAYHDTLTGLPNRTALHATIDTLLLEERERPLAVLLLDLDRFKVINELMGQDIGDRVLIEVGRRLATLTDRGVVQVARLGGDEFALVAPVTDSDAAVGLAEYIDEVLRVPIVLNEQLVDAPASIGIALYPEQGQDALSLLRCADTAMYHAKDRQGGVSVFDPAQARTNASTLSLLSELRRAVECNELVLNYQPKLDLSGRGKLAVEALVRWNHPTRGFVPPMNFIPFAEETGVIRNITMWVLRAAMDACVGWHRRGLAIKVAVNLSVRDLVRPELPAEFAGLLADTGCKPDWIDLEVTESAFATDFDTILSNLNALRALGCEIAIDDYGSEYSVLAYLDRLPVSELKIDKSFVLNMLTVKNDEFIVRSTIELAHRMGLRVTAEGVDSMEALERLETYGCDSAQGFFLCRPVPASALEAWYHEDAYRRNLAVLAVDNVRRSSAQPSETKTLASLP